MITFSDPRGALSPQTHDLRTALFVLGVSKEIFRDGLCATVAVGQLAKFGIMNYSRQAFEAMA